MRACYWQIPGDVVLFQRHRQFAAGALVLGDIAPKQVRLPVLTAIAPADARREDAHVASILNDKLIGNERGPPTLTQFDMVPVGGTLLIDGGAVLRNGNDRLHQ